MTVSGFPYGLSAFSRAKSALKAAFTYTVNQTATELIAARDDKKAHIVCRIVLACDGYAELKVEDNTGTTICPVVRVLANTTVTVETRGVGKDGKAINADVIVESGKVANVWLDYYERQRQD